MLRAVLSSLLFLYSLNLHARLGETLDQAEARYGLPKKPISVAMTPLVEGAKELTFEMQGWRIRCAFLRATDGNEYVVREEYTKIWNRVTMKAGGSTRIADFEADAVLKGEAGTGTWKPKHFGKADNDLVTTLGNQLAHSSGLLGTHWIRGDGAEARLLFGNSAMLFELPQALKWEAESKAIKEARARSNVPKF